MSSCIYVMCFSLPLPIRCLQSPSLLPLSLDLKEKKLLSFTSTTTRYEGIRT